MSESDNKVESRNDPFVKHSSTKIWQEVPSCSNPYIEDTCYCHGYELTELIAKCSFVDVLYLLFRGELPSALEAELLEKLMIGLINPGPRHPATRAAMNAGVSKTDLAHILPIALTINGGEVSGASDVEPAMRFLRIYKKKDPDLIADALTKELPKPKEGDWYISPGFGTHYSGIDIRAMKFARALSNSELDTPALNWGNEFAKCLEDVGAGWLHTGIAAAVLTDLGFHPRAGAGLYQLFSAPGLLAHGVEMANKPVTAMPFIDDSKYVIEYE